MEKTGGETTLPSLDTSEQTETTGSSSSTPTPSDDSSSTPSASSSSEPTSSSSTSSSSDSQTTDTSAQDCTPVLCHALNDLRPVISTAFAVAGRTATAFELPNDRRVLRVELFTGESSGTSRLAIWDTSGNDPGKELVGQGWTLDPMNQWQGANFTQPFDLVASTRYWVVWDPPVNAQANLSSSGDFPVHKFQAQGQTAWQTQSVHPMLRVYCCEL